MLVLLLHPKLPDNPPRFKWNTWIHQESEDLLYGELGVVEEGGAGDGDDDDDAAVEASCANHYNPGAGHIQAAAEALHVPFAAPA